MFSIVTSLWREKTAVTPQSRARRLSFRVCLVALKAGSLSVAEVEVGTKLRNEIMIKF